MCVRACVRPDPPRPGPLKRRGAGGVGAAVWSVVRFVSASLRVAVVSVNVGCVVSMCFVN